MQYLDRPQGNEIVLSQRATPDARSSIWVVHADGSGLREIHVQAQPACGGTFSDPSSQGCFEPSWSPDSTKIVFSRGRQATSTATSPSSTGTEAVSSRSRTDQAPKYPTGARTRSAADANHVRGGRETAALSVRARAHHCAASRWLARTASRTAWRASRYERSAACPRSVARPLPGRSSSPLPAWVPVERRQVLARGLARFPSGRRASRRPGGGGVSMAGRRAEAHSESRGDSRDVPGYLLGSPPNPRTWLAWDGNAPSS